MDAQRAAERAAASGGVRSSAAEASDRESRREAAGGAAGGDCCARQAAALTESDVEGAARAERARRLARPRGACGLAPARRQDRQAARDSDRTAARFEVVAACAVDKRAAARHEAEREAEAGRLAVEGESHAERARLGARLRAAVLDEAGVGKVLGSWVAERHGRAVSATSR